MSFSGTPLGQGRRLDRDTFLGKPNFKDPKITSPRDIPTSYNFTATSLGSQSPPKPSSPTRETYQNEENEPALARFAKRKHREAELASRPEAPTISTTAPTPSKWSVKDTTVNIANAFTIEAARVNSETMGVATQKPNNSWASSSRTQSHIPRSTSVEYEEQARATQGRRLPIPSNRIPGRGGSTSNISSNTLKPPSKNRSLQHVPDSEGEESTGPNGRATSPYQAVIAAAKRALAPALAPAVYYAIAPGPEDSSGEQQPTANGSMPGNDSTYSYEDEERFVQDAMQAAKADRRTNKRGRISRDNRAYQPTASDLESSSEEDDDGGRTKRGKTKPAGRVTSLPTVADGKGGRKRRTKSKGNIDVGSWEEDMSEDISHTDVRSQSAANRASIPRLSVEPPNTSMDQSYSMSMSEAGLQSIPEVPEEEVAQRTANLSQSTSMDKPRSGRPRRNSRATTPSRTQRFSPGSVLGKLVQFFVSIVIKILLVISSLGLYLGRAFGTIIDTLVNRPIRWASKAKPGLFSTLVKYVVIGFTILSAWYLLQNPALRAYIPRISLPSLPSRSQDKVPYTPPAAPPQDISEVAARLAKIEYALSGLTLENERIRAKTDQSVRGYSDLETKFSQMEGKISTEGRRISDSEARARDTIGKSLSGVKQEVEGLHAQLQAQQKKYEKEQARTPVVSDEEARAKLRGLEDRLAGAESSVREALELGKKAAASVPAVKSPVPASGAEWWGKTKGRVQLVTSSGQDVTGVISSLVDASVATAMNDRNGKVDFALHSGGARVVPSLTSATFEIKPNSVRSQVLGILTGNGYAIGRPPVTALHHELHNGHCWPFAGAQGQLGVALAVPAYIEEVTVDHVAKEVAFDMRSAPREMEVWGLVEGVDNVEKVKVWKEERWGAAKEAAEAAGEVVDAAWEKREREKEREAHPRSLPASVQYIRIARFTYDIHTSRNVQTFAVDPEVRALGVDFGVVALRVLNNWGREGYTCLYRFRVHGKRLGELPLPYEKKGEAALGEP